MALKKIILIFAVMLSVLVLTGTGYARASPPAEEWNRTCELRSITSVNSFQQTADAGYILTLSPRGKYNARGNSQYYFFDHINLLKIGPPKVISHCTYPSWSVLTNHIS